MCDDVLGYVVLCCAVVQWSEVCDDVLCCVVFCNVMLCTFCVVLCCGAV